MPPWSSKVKADGSIRKSVYEFLFESVKKNDVGRTHRLRDICGFMMEPFLDALPVAYWGRRSPKLKVDLDPPCMGSCSTLIVTMGLSSLR